jgi:NADPH:quinone reductase-like Zn-dependent oxidoreductase
MRAIVLEKFGGLDSLVIKEIADPEPKPGHVVIQVKAFGINYAEMHMRRGEWAEAAEDRHRVRWYRQVLPRRRIQGGYEGRGSHGRLIPTALGTDRRPISYGN